VHSPANGSTLTEEAVLFVLLTRRPAFRSRPGRTLSLSSLLGAAVTLTIPYLPFLAEPLDLNRCPGRSWSPSSSSSSATS
jgi:P-type Mg2+ transporter